MENDKESTTCYHVCDVQTQPSTTKDNYSEQPKQSTDPDTVECRDIKSSSECSIVSNVEAAPPAKRRRGRPRGSKRSSSESIVTSREMPKRSCHTPVSEGNMLELADNNCVGDINSQPVTKNNCALPEQSKENNTNHLTGNDDKKDSDKCLAEGNGDLATPFKKPRGRPRGHGKPKDNIVIRDMPNRSCRNAAPEPVKVIPTSPPPEKSMKHRLYSWKVNERKQLLTGLKMHYHKDTASLEKYVPTKSGEQIEWFLKRLRTHWKKKEFSEKVEISQNTKKKEPINKWLKIAHGMVKNMTDHSTVLSSVMRVAGDLEPHHPPYDPDREPDYTKIYHYLSQILGGVPPAKLSPVDSAVVLHLMEDTCNVLKQASTHEEQEMLKKKYQLLMAKSDKDPQTNYIKLGKALNVRTESDQAAQDGSTNGTSMNSTISTRVEPAVVPSTSSKDTSAPDVPVPGPSSRLDGQDTITNVLLESMDEARPEFDECDKRPHGGKRISPSERAKQEQFDMNRSQSNVTPDPTSSAKQTEEQPGKDIVGLKPGKLVSVNPLCIDVKYLKLGKVFSGVVNVTEKRPQVT